MLISSLLKDLWMPWIGVQQKTTKRPLCGGAASSRPARAHGRRGRNCSLAWFSIKRASVSRPTKPARSMTGALMTARLLTSELPGVCEGPGFSLRPQGAALALAALICALTAAGISTYSNHHPAKTKNVQPLVAPTPDSHATAVRDRTEERHIRRLASAVAKRYRVADDATRQFVAIAYREARRNHLDPLLVLAVIAVESRFDPRAESDSGAMGLMQVIPRYHVRNAEDATRAAMLD